MLPRVIHQEGEFKSFWSVCVSMRIQDQFGLFDDATILSFTDLDHSVYNAVLRNLTTIVDMRVADLAKLAGVSNASVVRFCKKCGYSGFPEFKYTIANRVNEASLTDKPLPSVSDDMRAFFESPDFPAFNERIHQAYDVLRWVDGLFILGTGRSGALATYAAHLYGSLGIPAMPITDFPSYAVAIRQKEVGVITISYSGTSPMVHAALHELVEADMTVVAITSNHSSPIARLSDVCIYLNKTQNPALRAASQVTHIPALYAIEELGRLLFNDALSHKEH